MATVFTDIEKLANALRRRVGRSGIFGIDGWTGVGKTTLAKGLAKKLCGTYFDLDCALTHDQKAYVSALQLDVVSETLATQNRPLLVSGVCLLEVLGKVDVQLDACIYVKRMALWGWADEDELNGIDFGVRGAGGETVREEMRRHHQKWQPHFKADYQFQRTD